MRAQFRTKFRVPGQPWEYLPGRFVTLAEALSEANRLRSVGFDAVASFKPR